MNWDSVEALDMALSFQRGEEKGFQFFFNELYYQLNYYAYKIVNDTPTAEDAVENSFIKIWERRDTFTHPKVIKAWLFTTVRNDCLNKLQQINYKLSKAKEIDDSTNLIEQGVDFNIIRSEVFKELYSYIEELPLACRTIFKMFYLEGLSVKEICEIQHLKTSTVKNQKIRGLSILRKKYNISKEAVEAKEYRWVKQIFFNTYNSKRRARLYGMSGSNVLLIKKGEQFKNITSQFGRE